MHRFLHDSCHFIPIISNDSDSISDSLNFFFAIISIIKPIGTNRYNNSLLQSNCHIPIKADTDTISQINETFVAAKQFLKPKLNAIRRFLTEMRLQQFDMNPVNMKMIQEDFIEMRRTFNATADDLHMMLILSRMLGIIHGKTALDAESWSQAKLMEAERRKRIDALPKVPNTQNTN